MLIGIAATKSLKNHDCTYMIAICFLSVIKVPLDSSRAVINCKQRSIRKTKSPTAFHDISIVSSPVNAILTGVSIAVYKMRTITTDCHNIVALELGLKMKNGNLMWSSWLRKPRSVLCKSLSTLTLRWFDSSHDSSESVLSTGLLFDSY